MIHLDVLPPMKCDTGCGDCCGPVLCKEHEFQAVNRLAFAKGIVPMRQGTTCPWYQDGQCQVYEARPFICRLFGHAPRLTCSRGYNVNVAPSLEKRLTRQYGKPTRFLHEVLDNWQPMLLESLRRTQ